MNRLTLALAAALALLAPPAEAGKFAVLFEANLGRSRNPNYAAVIDLLDRGGQPYDVFNVGVRTWGEAAKADSIWFRERYDAIFIPWLDGGESGTGLLGSWGATFLNAAGAAGIHRSPLSGHWGPPAYVLGVGSFNSASGSTNEASDAWVPGVRVYGGALFPRPAQSNRGTWGYKMLCRFRGNARDTLHTDADRMVSIYGTWPGNGSVAALVWPDSALGGLPGGHQAGDTSAAVWRFRPVAGKPGITYSVLPINRFGSIDGLLYALQHAYVTTPAEPVRKIEIPIEPHNSYGGTTNRALAVQHVRAIHDTLAANGIPLQLALAQVSGTDFASPHDADTRAELKRVVNAHRARWQPGTNSGLTGFTFYTAADTTAIRTGFNSTMRTATRDSFGLAATSMSNRFVSPAGIFGAWTAKVLADAGIVTAVSTVQAAPANWTLQTGSSQADPPLRFPVPGPNETRAIYVAGTIGWTDGATFAAVRGSTTEHDWVGANVTQRIGWAAQTYSSLYWHMSTNTTGADGYWRWFASVIGRHFRFFDRVIRPAPQFATQ